MGSHWRQVGNSNRNRKIVQTYWRRVSSFDNQCSGRKIWRRIKSLNLNYWINFWSILNSW